MSRPPVFSDWAWLAGLSGLWGSAFLFTKIAVGGAPPTVVVAGRLLVAAVAMLAMARWLGLALPSRARVWRQIAVLACVGNALPFFLISWGQQRIDSSLAGILMAPMPLVTLVLAHWFVVGERMTAPRVAGSLLGFLGVAVLTGLDALGGIGGERAELSGQLSVLAGSLCYAANAILSRRLPAMHPLVSGTGVMLVASALMLPLALWLEAARMPLPAAGPLAAIVALGLGATAAGTFVYFRLIQGPGAIFTVGTNYLIPLVALAAGMAFLGERPPWRALISLGLILGGLALTQLRVEWRGWRSAVSGDS